MAAYDRLLRDIKASPSKAAVLGVLLAIGIFFWVPPVWRFAMSTPSAEPAVVAFQEVEKTAPASPTATEDSSAELHWPELERLRKQDSLYRPATLAEINVNAFSFNKDVLPLDAELAVDPPALPSAAGAIASSPSDDSADARNEVAVAQQFDLRSTMIGSGRRAAVINDRVYREGDEFWVDGKRVRLSRVDSRRVTIDADGRSFELRIDPFALNSIQSDQYR